MALIDELLAQAQRDLSAREVQIVSELLKSYGVALSRIERELRTIDAQIAELIASGDDIDDRYIQRQRWWREVQASIQQQMARWSGEAAQGIAALQSGGVTIGVGVASEIAKAAGSPFRGRVYAEAFERWVSAIQPGAPVRQVIDGYGDKVADSVLQRMTEGIGGGKAPRSIVREIMRDVGGVADEARIMTLARTESMRAYRGASSDTMGKLQERGIVSGYVWLAALGPRCCVACVARHGTFYRVPPNDHHPNCRCVLRPVANPELVPGGGWKGKTGPEWLADQPEKVQRQILLNDARYDAWKAGTPLSDMVSVRHSDIWGRTMGIRSLESLNARIATRQHWSGVFAEVAESDNRPVLGTLDPAVQALYPDRFSDQITIRRADFQHIVKGHPELDGEQWQIVESLVNPVEIRRDRDRPLQRLAVYGTLDGVPGTPYVKTVVIVRSAQSGMANTVRTSFPVTEEMFLRLRELEEIIVGEG